MNSLKQLKEEKERLISELADSCREIVEIRFSYNDLYKEYNLQKKVLMSVLIKHKYAQTEEEAIEKVNQMIHDASEPQQLELPLKMENDAY